MLAVIIVSKCSTTPGPVSSLSVLHAELVQLLCNAPYFFCERLHGHTHTNQCCVPLIFSY